MKILTLILTACLAMSGAVMADEKVASYLCHVSDNDLKNSSGKTLKNAGGILQQDRANYHKLGKRDESDQNCKFFTTAKKRAMIPEMFKRGKNDAGIKQNIIEGDSWVTVDVYLNASGQHYIKASLAAG